MRPARSFPALSYDEKMTRARVHHHAELTRRGHLACWQGAEGVRYAELVECARCGRSGVLTLDTTMSGLASVRGEVFANDCK